MDIRAEFEAAYYRIAVSYNTPSGQVPLPRLASGQYKSFDVEEAWRFYRAGAEDMRERAADEVDCGCECRQEVLAVMVEHSARRARNACKQRTDCCAVQAAEIRALPVE